MTRVLLAVDGSDLDHRLGEVAVELFGVGAQLFAVNVGQTPPPVMVPAPDVALGYAVARVAGRIEPLDSDPATGRRPETDMERAARDVAASSSPDGAVPIGDVGDPAESIVRVARELGADVIVVGARARGWLSRIIDPPVSSGVAHRSPVPVLVVHDDAAA